MLRCNFGFINSGIFIRCNLHWVIAIAKRFFFYLGVKPWSHVFPAVNSQKLFRRCKVHWGCNRNHCYSVWIKPNLCFFSVYKRCCPGYWLFTCRLAEDDGASRPERVRRTVPLHRSQRRRREGRTRGVQPVPGRELWPQEDRAGQGYTGRWFMMYLSAHPT